jgi:ribosomal protein S18 acetylase RimI-like enzyme
MTSAYEPVEPSIIKSTREAIERQGVESLTVNDLAEKDLAHILWSGGPLHSKSVGKALERVKSGQVEYLAVRAPDGYPISIGGIDFGKQAGVGYLWQLSTHGQLQSLGLGSRLIREAEKRIKARGLAIAMLGVEDGNDRAKGLYDRLGYLTCGHEQDSWDEADQQGNVYTYHAEIILMRKSLG